MSSRTVATNDNLLQIFNKYNIQATCFNFGEQLTLTGSIAQNGAITSALLYFIGPLPTGCFLVQLDIASKVTASATNNYYRNSNYRVFVQGGSIQSITSFGGFTSASAGYTPPAVGTDIAVTGAGANLLLTLNNISTLNTTYVIRCVGISSDLVRIGYHG